MASYTPNLNLYKKDPIADGNNFFNIKTMMNDNWDKIDEKVKAALDDIGDLQSEQVRIATGSYVGTGTYGASNPCSLTFDFVPKFVWIRMDGAAGNGYNELPWVGSQTVALLVDSCNCEVVGTTFRYWATSDEGTQCNLSGIKYFWVAFG